MTLVVKWPVAWWLAQPAWAPVRSLIPSAIQPTVASREYYKRFANSSCWIQLRFLWSTFELLVRGFISGR